MARRKKSPESTLLLDSPEAITKIHQLRIIEPTLLGERLRRVRSDRKISQRDLTDGLFTSAYLSSVELGKTRPTLETLGKLAERLGESVDFFLRPSGAGKYRGPGQEGEFDAEQVQQFGLKQHLLQAETALVENNLDQAEQEFAEIASASGLIYADQAQYYLLKAALKNRQGQGEKALAELEQLAAQPEINSIVTADATLSALLELETGRAYKVEAQFFTALDHFHRGLTFEPEKNPWRRALLLEAGDAFQQIGEFEKAADFIQRGLAMFGADYYLKTAHTFYQEAETLAGQGNFQQAAFLMGQGRQAAQLAGEIPSRLDFTLKASRLSYQLKKFEEAANFARVAESLVRLSEANPGKSQLGVLVLLAKSYFQKGESALAQFYLDQAAAIFETNPEIEPLEKATYFEIAALVYSGSTQNQQEKAAGYYEQAIALLEPLLTNEAAAQGEVGVQLADIYYNYSRLLKDLGRVDQTLENLEKAYRLRSR
jgi:tetratricopeptide (TPR) repeat protein